jgi:RNA polymerase sigma-70 factor (ECF subfamily)
MVLAAGGPPGQARDAAMEALCRDCWKPVFAYVRSRGHDTESALDLTQSFFEKLLQKDWLSGLKREGGHFRSFLLVMIQRFLISEYRRETREKRGSGLLNLSLDAADAIEQPSRDESPEAAFDRRWAVAVIERAMARLRAEAAAVGKESLFTAVSPFLSSESRDGYAAAAHQAGMSKGAFSMAVLRLRARLRDRVREEIAETLTDASQVDDEMRHLLAALRR